MLLEEKGRRPGASRRSRWQRDLRGNMQIVETMVVSILVVGAVVAVSTMDVPVSHSERFKHTNEQLVGDSLGIMANRPSDGYDGVVFGSVLEEYVMEALAGNQKPLQDYLNKTLPVGASFNVMFDNGYGAPIPLLAGGAPPREAVASSIQFVPKLAYTFMVSDFGSYHGDFQMNVNALPISNAVILHDEGDTVELAITVREVPAPGDDTPDPVVIRTFGHTALRHNDADKRSWPSVSIYHPSSPSDHFFDASLVSPALIERTVAYRTDAPGSHSAYNVTYPVTIEETAGYPVPAGAQLSIQMPRGWDLDETDRNYLANNTALGNNEYWTDFEYSGHWSDGMIIKAKLKNNLAGGSVPFMMNAWYLLTIDSAYPHFSPMTFTMGNGVQGMSTIVVIQPAVNPVGGLERDTFLSIAKPIIAGDTSTWGAVLTNTADPGNKIDILSVSVRQPQGKELFKNVQSLDSFVPGTWSETGTGHYTWVPDVVEDTRLSAGDLAWLSFSVEGGPTKDNSFRNQDYLVVEPEFNADNTTSGSNDLGSWKYSKRAYNMGEEWVYRLRVPPSDGDPSAYTPGWPDQDGYTYWVKGGTTDRAKLLGTNWTYDVTLTSAMANGLGNYQGSHVSSSLDIVDANLDARRDFGLGEKVHIKNDFNALFGKLSTAGALPTIDVADLRIDTYVYTPEKAWKSKWSDSFTSSAEVVTAIQDVKHLQAADMNGDGAQDVMTIDSNGLMFGLDGRDGTKFWFHDSASAVSSTATTDLDADGVPELVIGYVDGTLRGFDTRPLLPLGASRELWSVDLTPAPAGGVGSYRITDIVPIAPSGSSLPQLVVASTPSSLDALIYGLTIQSGAAPWTVTTHSLYDATDIIRDIDLRVTDLEPVRIDTPASSPPSHVAVASRNATLMLLPTQDLSAATWITPLDDKPHRLSARDLNQDGADEIIVDTFDDGVTPTTGKRVFPVDGRTGTWRTDSRSSGAAFSLVPYEGAMTPGGGTFVVTDSRYVLQDTGAMYDIAVAWPNLDATEGPRDFTNMLLGTWTGLHMQDNNTVYIIEELGEVRYSKDPIYPLLDSGYDWARLTLTGTPSTPGGSLYRDVYVPDDWHTGGRVYGFTMAGAIHTMDDRNSFVALTTVCADAGITCSGTTAAQRYEVREDLGGAPTDIEVLFTVNPPAGSHMTYLLNYNIQSTTWSQIGSFTGRTGQTLDRGPNGNYYVGGFLQGSTTPFVSTYPPLGAWTDMTIVSPGTKITSVKVGSSGEGYMADDSARIWRLVDGKQWVPVPTFGATAATTILMEDPAGTFWAMGRDYDATSLSTHVPSAVAYFPAAFENLAPEFGATKLEIMPVEGYLSEPGTNELQQSITALHWSYRTANAPTWTDLPFVDDGRESDLDFVSYNVTIDCAGMGGCAGIELRAQLDTRAMYDSTSGFRRVDAYSPLIRDISLTLWDGLDKQKEIIAIGDTTLQAGSTAVYSSFARGIMLPYASDPSWMYEGKAKPETPANNAKRQVATSAASVFTGSGWPQVVISEDISGGARMSVINGTTGALIDPITGTSSFIVDATDSSDQLLVMDINADGIEDIVATGKYELGASWGSARVWYADSDIVHTLVAPSEEQAFLAVPTGVWKGLQTVAFASDADNIVSMRGTVDESTPTLQWRSDPAASQGMATFEYEIPTTAMYGTGFVVSELVFKVTEGGNTVTQTARLLDWFNITPPGQSVPRPPVYTVEVVSWFNEG